MFKIKGKIVFDPTNYTKKHNKQSSWKKTVIVIFNDDLADYYSWFIKTRFNLNLNKPLRGSHFTIINDGDIDETLYNQCKELFDGKEITVEYDPTLIRANEKGHWWLKAYCQDAINIRNIMNLGDPYFGYHITIGRAAHLELEHSEYIRKQCIKFNL